MPSSDQALFDKDDPLIFLILDEFLELPAA